VLKVWHGDHTRSLRVVWLLEEIGLDYQIEKIPRGPALKTDEYLAINPFGTLPAIEDGEVRLSESGAIVQYLLDRYGEAPLKVSPNDPHFADYLQGLHFGEATLTPPLTAIAQHTIIRPADRRIPAVAAEGRARFGEICAILDRRFHDRKWFAGDVFTGADVMVGYALHLASLLNLMGEAPKHLGHYWDLLRARRGYKAAIVK
jgi:glutathione S-transferase